MKIGIDACCWANQRGFGRFTRELLDALLKLDEANEYLFFIDSKMSHYEDFPSRAKLVVARTENSAVNAASADGRRSLSDLWAMTREVYKHKVDVFFFPAVYSYFPLLNRTKTVVTIHDMIADHHPDLVFPSRKSKLFWKLKQNLAVRQADIIATVSENSSKEIAEYFRIPETRLRVISEAARPVFRVLPATNGFVSALAKYDLAPGEKFLLYVGGISPHKNLKTLITAFKRTHDSETVGQPKLILVGDYENDPFFSAYPDLRRQVSDFGLDEKVLFTGFVPDEDLAYLYNAATMLVFPSFEEGFGLPAIEAMACGTPVAASCTGSLPEVLGDAGRFFDPSDADSMSAVIKDLLADEPARRKMRDSGLARSQKFQWKRAAEETLAIFNELADNDR